MHLDEEAGEEEEHAKDDDAERTRKHSVLQRLNHLENTNRVENWCDREARQVCQPNYFEKRVAPIRREGRSITFPSADRIGRKLC